MKLKAVRLESWLLVEKTLKFILGKQFTGEHFEMYPNTNEWICSLNKCLLTLTGMLSFLQCQWRFIENLLEKTLDALSC